MRNHSRRKHETGFLCGAVNRPEQAAALRASEARLRVHTYSRMRERSITSPLSQVLNPARLWPPQRTAGAIPQAAAARTAACTSVTSAQRAISAGFRATIAFQIARASGIRIVRANQVTVEVFSESRGEFVDGAAHA